MSETSAQRDEDRLTEGDRADIQARMVTVARSWPAGTVDAETLGRVGPNAIGCTRADLRTSELAWVDERAGQVAWARAVEGGTQRARTSGCRALDERAARLILEGAPWLDAAWGVWGYVPVDVPTVATR